MITNPLAIIAFLLGTIFLVPMVCHKIRIPSIVGFILVGIIAGPNGLHLILGSDIIQTLGKIGMLYIMLQAGIEVDINDFRQNRNNSIVFGLYSFIFPFILGLLTSKMLGFDWITSSLMGAMYGSHTLMTYPIVSRYGVQKNSAVNIAVGGSMLTISLALLVLAIIKSNVIQNYTDWCGLEGILGAFICGVAMNRLVPNLSPVMMRINFVGNLIFVPLFLMGVGMMIDMTLLWSGWTTLIIAVVMVATKLIGKWVAAWMAQKSFGLQPVERQLIFGLTHATAAGTLAIVTIGYQIGIFNAEILNASVVMILALCSSASFITEYAAKQLALQEEARLEADKSNNEWLMMTIAENRHYELKELSELSELHAPELSNEIDWSDAINHIEHQRKAAIIYHPAQPINTITRMLVAVPRYAEKEHDFISCFGLIRRLSSQIGARVIFYTNEETQRVLQTFCRRKGKFLRAGYREMNNWEEVLMLAKQMRPDDLIVLINARPSTPSYNPLFDQVPNMMTNFFADHSYMIVYPEQETGSAIPDILTGDNTQASTTWSIISGLKKRIVSSLQTRPTNRKA